MGWIELAVYICHAWVERLQQMQQSYLPIRPSSKTASTAIEMKQQTTVTPTLESQIKQEVAATVQNLPHIATAARLVCRRLNL